MCAYPVTPEELARLLKRAEDRGEPQDRVAAIRARWWARYAVATADQRKTITSEIEAEFLA